MSYFVFEMDLEMKRSPAVLEVARKYFLMDEADGLHHGLRVFTVERPVHTPETGLAESENARMFITWQLRPAHKNSDTGSVASRVLRKRPFFAPDEIDAINAHVYRAQPRHSTFSVNNKDLIIKISGVVMVRPWSLYYESYESFTECLLRVLRSLCYAAAPCFPARRTPAQTARRPARAPAGSAARASPRSRAPGSCSKC